MSYDLVLSLGLGAVLFIFVSFAVAITSDDQDLGL